MTVFFARMNPSLSSNKQISLFLNTTVALNYATMKGLLIVTLLLPVFAFSQRNVTSQLSVDILNKGNAYFDLEIYEDAIDEFARISINDTNYAVAQYRMALSLLHLENYDEAKEVLYDLLDYKIAYSFKNYVYVALGDAYDLSGEYDEAIKVYTDALKLMPYESSLYYARGLCHEKNEHLKEAMADYQQSILGNVYNVQSHFRLGYICARMGLYNQSMLSFLTAIWIEPSDPNTANVAYSLDLMAGGTNELDPADQSWYTSSNPDPYARYNERFSNQYALYNHKCKHTLPTDYGKQLDYFLKFNKYDENSNEFWNQVYMPFYDKIYKTKKLDLFLLITLANVDNTDTQAKIKPKLPKMEAFYTASKDDFFLMSQKRHMMFKGELSDVVVDYSNGYLNAIGEGVIGTGEDRKPVGEFEYYHENGMLSMTGTYDGSGRQFGKWTSYTDFDGSKLVEQKYTTLTDKTHSDFYPTGELAMYYHIVNDYAEDTVYHYYRNGSVMEKFLVSRGMRNGFYKSYHPNGALEQESNFNNDIPSGELKIYHSNGQLQSETRKVNGKMEGPSKSYYPSGQLEIECAYKADLHEGPYKEYYANGKLRIEGTFKNGVQVGELKEYYSNGMLKNTVNLDESGKQNGESIFYDIDGKKYHQLEFVKGNVTKITFIDKAGTSTEIAAIKNKKLDYVFNYPSGKVNVRGSVVDGKNEGDWKYYDYYGNLTKVEKYKKGDIVDTMVEYHSNGKVSKATQINNNSYSGLYLEYNIFGDLMVEGTLNYGNQDRDWYGYYTDGTIKGQSTFINGIKHGYQIDYGTRGQLLSVEQYDNGKVTFSRYLDTLGNSIAEFGELDGYVEVPAFNNAYMRFKGHYVNGTRTGENTLYYPNGQIAEQRFYSGNMLTGKEKYFTVNGELVYEDAYEEDKREGKAIYYNRNGKVRGEENYSNGILEGPFVEFHENGNKYMEGEHLAGERHGKVTTYGYSGEVAMIRYYDKGVITSYAYLGTDGKEVAPIPLVGNEMHIVCYYKNGKKSMDHKRVNGLLEGKYLTYHENGKIAEESNFTYGVEDGKSITYNTSGGKMIENDYKKGELNGWSISYYTNGKVMYKLPYMFGLLHGTAYYYGEDGKLLQTIVYYNNEPLEYKQF